MRKKTLVCLLAVAMMISMAACGNKSGDRTLTEPNTLETIESIPESMSEAETEANSEAISEASGESETKEELASSKEAGNEETKEESEKETTRAYDPILDGIDAADYVTRYEELVPMLEMGKAMMWQMSEDSFVVNGFYVEYDAEYHCCSMKNEGNAKVSFAGINLDDSEEECIEKLEAAGWKDPNGYGTYYKRDADGYINLFEMEFEDDELISWYWNNWPEGDIDLSGI